MAVCVTQSLVLCLCFVDVVCLFPFVRLLLTIVLSELTGGYLIILDSPEKLSTVNNILKTYGMSIKQMLTDTYCRRV
jgi:hypothetical protein